MFAEDGERDSLPTGYLGVARDVTSDLELERQKDEFLANVSHDLRTPLSAIKASVGVVLSNEPPGMAEALHRMLANIDQAADRMTGLVNDLLELARYRAGRTALDLTRTDLRAVAQRAVQTVEPLALTRGQRVELRLPEAEVPLSVDRSRLERALVNLLGNAQRHGREGGLIRLTLEVDAGVDEAVFAVQDDGPGILPSEHQRIFHRFHRGEAAASGPLQGSGLGLPIARAMVEVHGGRLWVESDGNGSGATFRIALPRTLRPRASAPPLDVDRLQAAPAKPAAPGQERANTRQERETP
jgi:signal transduction histidine kinase